ncbi:zinc ribbon domain-containing protein [Ruminococcaceae bacterium OttesenSCG-928-L11]|nr:zinc ribbon domain-containing protein [Ruminococcaceae bacterium OttesenSCG-928-L11]
MFRFVGIHAKLRHVCNTAPSPCPHCERPVSFRVDLHYVTPHIFYIPTFRIHPKYVAVCPRCGTVFALNAEKGRLLEQRPKRPLGPGDLSPPERQLPCPVE